MLRKIHISLYTTFTKVTHKDTGQPVHFIYQVYTERYIPACTFHLPSVHRKIHTSLYISFTKCTQKDTYQPVHFIYLVYTERYIPACTFHLPSVHRKIHTSLYISFTKCTQKDTYQPVHFIYQVYTERYTPACTFHLLMCQKYSPDSIISQVSPSLSTPHSLVDSACGVPAGPRLRCPCTTLEPSLPFIRRENICE